MELVGSLKKNLLQFNHDFDHFIMLQKNEDKIERIVENQ